MEVLLEVLLEVLSSKNDPVKEPQILAVMGVMLGVTWGAVLPPAERLVASPSGAPSGASGVLTSASGRSLPARGNNL